MPQAPAQSLRAIRSLRGAFEGRTVFVSAATYWPPPGSVRKSQTALIDMATSSARHRAPRWVIMYVINKAASLATEPHVFSVTLPLRARLDGPEVLCEAGNSQRT
jgi:hypothetical protein